MVDMAQLQFSEIEKAAARSGGNVDRARFARLVA